MVDSASSGVKRAPTTLTQDIEYDLDGARFRGPCSCSCSGSVYVGVSKPKSDGTSELIILQGQTTTIIDSSKLK